MRQWLGGPATMALALLVATEAHAQRRSGGHAPPPASAPSSPPASGAEPPAGLRSRLGIEVAARLLRSPDADDVLRGTERASAIRTPEALALLVRAAGPVPQGAPDSRPPIDGAAWHDSRALLAAARGLATRVSAPAARAALADLITAPAPARDPSRDDADAPARVALARQQAAIALDRSGNTVALEALVTIARAGGAGQEAALEALAVDPPAGPIALGGGALATRSIVALAARLGELRTLDSVLAIASGATDPALRAAAIDALGVAGDTRVLAIAREALREPDPHVRLAGAGALVKLGTSDAAPAVEACVGDKETAIEALGLARQMQGEGVTRAVAALAAASADPAARMAALAALGRQTTPLAVQALLTLAADPGRSGDAAFAIGRSPSAAAIGALEEMAAGSARLAARAYLVRRFVRGERSSRLDALLRRLAASSDARDRAVGMQALVALGEAPLEAALADRDPRVRRAGAMAAVAFPDGQGTSRLLARLGVETDETTRRVLALGLVEGDPAGTIPTSELVDRARSGGPDAPLAALAVASRAERATDATVSALLVSRDPVVRAHAARGLGLSAAPDAPGRLARAYAFEVDAAVRRALIATLAARGAGQSSTLALAAELDPDAVVRATARGAVEGKPPAGAPLVREVAWLRVVAADGAELPETTGALIRSDGLAVPVAFDEDGYALVPGVPPGEAQLRLAPGLPAYRASSQ